ncbi:GDSL-type esterase/lipase family protein [Flavobacterium sp. FlaQc-48]|uniref:GDSL-type esterase/lipase family protein n=1 Tax=Flavobacterium sp. FlaQc-48 TaxID=3374181 RepID=UPI0037569A23
MKKILLIKLLLSFSIWSMNAQIKVACIGNSITSGARVESREVNCYPAQLQNMLGGKFEVKNFGISARTMLRKGDHPYWNDQTYKDAQNYLPDIVIIKLGTNDSKPENWKYKSEFEKDYKDFIDSFSQLSSHPKIYICKPVPAFSSGNFGITDQVISGEIIPLIEKIAREQNVELIDLHTPFLGKDYLVSDNIHPNSEGAKFLAKIVFKAITRLPCFKYYNYRNDFTNSKIKFEKEKTGRVAFLGGSITYNGGWRDSICKYLKQKFPKTKFEFINAGIPSTGSVPGAFRFTNDVWPKGRIDLLFVEASVNDGPDGNNTGRAAMIRGMEGIIRHARELNPSIDIVLMHFADPNKIKMYNEGKTPEVIQQFEKVAEHYGISSINLAKEVAERINNNEFSWEKDFINLHPSPFGQGIYSRSIIEFFNTAWNRELPQNPKINKHAIPEKKLDLFSYSRGAYVDIKQAKLTKGWIYLKKWKPLDVAGRQGFENVPVLEATEPGAELQFTFTGTAAGIFVAAGPDAGIIETSVDGKPFIKTGLFTKWSTALHLPWLYVLQDDLTQAEHKLTIKVSNEHNLKSKGNACRIVYFVVNK